MKRLLQVLLVPVLLVGGLTLAASPALAVTSPPDSCVNSTQGPGGYHGADIWGEWNGPNSAYGAEGTLNAPDTVVGQLQAHGGGVSDTQYWCSEFSGVTLRNSNGSWLEFGWTLGWDGYSYCGGQNGDAYHTALYIFKLSYDNNSVSCEDFGQTWLNASYDGIFRIVYDYDNSNGCPVYHLKLVDPGNGGNFWQTDKTVCNLHPGSNAWYEVDHQRAYNTSNQQTWTRNNHLSYDVDRCASVDGAGTCTSWVRATNNPAVAEYDSPYYHSANIGWEQMATLHS